MDNINSQKKRKLPRHVEGRIMVGQMPLKSLLMVLPLSGIIIFFTVIWFSKTSLFIAIVLIGIVVGLFSEFGQKETGLAQLINIIKYQIKGDYVFERINVKKINSGYSRNIFFTDSSFLYSNYTRYIRYH